jgi:hypothetical protein
MPHTLADWSDAVSEDKPIDPSPPVPEPLGSMSARSDSTADWAVRCSRRILELDARIDAANAAHLALFMSTRGAWRQHPPHEAAERMYRLPSND